MIAMGDDQALYLLEFENQRGSRVRREIFGSIPVVERRSESIDLINKELSQYFEGKLTEFTTPLVMLGTPFQISVWDELRKIPYGKTCSYAALASAVGKPSAFRAAALANGANRFAIIIPCHRVINSNGDIGGYGGGLDQKRWLLRHEVVTEVVHDPNGACHYDHQNHQHEEKNG